MAGERGLLRRLRLLVREHNISMEFSLEFICVEIETDISTYMSMSILSVQMVYKEFE